MDFQLETLLKANEDYFSAEQVQLFHAFIKKQHRVNASEKNYASNPNDRTESQVCTDLQELIDFDAPIHGTLSECYFAIGDPDQAIGLWDAGQERALRKRRREDVNAIKTIIEAELVKARDALATLCRVEGNNQQLKAADISPAGLPPPPCNSVSASENDTDHTTPPQEKIIMNNHTQAPKGESQDAPGLSLDWQQPPGAKKNTWRIEFSAPEPVKLEWNNEQSKPQWIITS